VFAKYNPFHWKSFAYTVLKTNSGKKIEDIKENKITILKELGKLIP